MALPLTELSPLVDSSVPATAAAAVAVGRISDLLRDPVLLINLRTVSGRVTHATHGSVGEHAMAVSASRKRTRRLTRDGKDKDAASYNYRPTGRFGMVGTETREKGAKYALQHMNAQHTDPAFARAPECRP